MKGIVIILFLNLAALPHHVSPQLVALTSSLNGRSVAYPQQEITFTCETKGSPIIAWSSNHYIGGNGAQLEFTTATHDRMATRTSLINTMTIATLVNVTEEDGVTIIVFKLRIKILPQYSISSISCHNVGHNTVNTSTFQCANVSAQEVSYSNKQQEDGVCPGDRINLSCVSIDSQSHAWSSAEYINSEQLRFSVDDPDNIRHKSPQNPDVVAWLTNVSQVNGVSQITSSLNITILPSITMRNHSVECINSDVGTRSTVTFHYADDCPESTSPAITTTTVTKSMFDRNGVHNLQENWPCIALSTYIAIVVSYTYSP